MQRLLSLSLWDLWLCESVNPLILLAVVVGVLTRVVDDYEDEGLSIKIYKPVVFLFGCLYGFLISYVIKEINVVAPIAVAIIISLLIKGKIDFFGHTAGIASFILFSYVFGLKFLSTFSIGLFFIFLFTSILDEIFSDVADQKKRKTILYKFLYHRPILEITAFAVSLITQAWEMWIAILLYDIGAGYIPVHKILIK